MNEDIGWAVKQMRKGRIVKRRHWAKAKYAQLIPKNQIDDERLVCREGHVCSDWTPTKADLLAVDWEHS